MLISLSRQRTDFTHARLPCLGDANQRTACIGSFPLLKISFRVHELVAGSNAWRVCAINGETKVVSFALSAALIIPRVRTYRTKKPSRFVHALPARPLKVHGGD